MNEFVIKNGVLYKYKGNASNVVIPNGVTKIGCYAFDKCEKLISIDIPSSVVAIYEGAFKNCTNLKSINIPNSVTFIDEWAFSFCKNLTSIVIPNSVTIIGFGAFCSCIGLTSIDIPSSVTDICSYAFDECYCLTRINLPRSINSIGCSVFNGIRNVKPQYTASGALRAYKAFNRYWQCRGFQYEIGKSFHIEGRRIKCCKNGFHACQNPLDVFDYYDGDLDYLHFAEVELSGTMDYEANKVAASDIKIVRELTATDLANIYNSMEKE